MILIKIDPNSCIFITLSGHRNKNKRSNEEQRGANTEPNRIIEVADSSQQPALFFRCDVICCRRSVITDVINLSNQISDLICTPFTVSFYQEKKRKKKNGSVSAEEPQLRAKPFHLKTSFQTTTNRSDRLHRTLTPV